MNGPIGSENLKRVLKTSAVPGMLALAVSMAVSSGWASGTQIKPGQPSGLSAQAVNGGGKAPAELAASARWVRELGGISEYRLPNGLQILLFPDESQSTTTVNITYRVGSRHEAPGEYGMAHLLEHLVFKGTPSHRDIPAAFAMRGVRFNGTTTVDRTNYFASFNANADTLDFALALEADRMINSFIAKSDLDKEMTVVRNEFERGENNGLQVLNQRVNAAAYAWHPYGKSTIGARSDIENVPIEKLQAFYKRWYRPDNATLLVAGNFDKAATLARIAQHFGPLKRPPEAMPQPYTVEPAQDGERTVMVRRVGGQPLVLARYHVPAAAHPDSAALMVFGLLMSSQPSGPLYKQLVEPKLAVAAMMGGLGGADPGGVQVFAALPPDADVAKVEQLLLDLVEGRNVKPFDERDLARVHEQAVAGYREQMKRPEALIQQISGLIGAGDWRLLFQLMEDIPKVTLADVERVRQQYFRSANRTLGRYIPSAQVERVEIPVAPPLDQRLAALQGPPKVEEGEVFDPTPPLLASRTEVQSLPSGIELHTLSKRTRGKAVQLQMRLRWGERAETFARRGSDVLARLVMEGSTGYGKQQLQDELVKLRANLNLSSDDQGATLHIRAEQDTLLPALKIAADLLQNPLLPAAAFERLQKSAIAGLQASRQEPETQRREAVRGHYNAARQVESGHPDYIKSLDDRIHAVQSTRLEDLRAIHQDLWSANEARVAVVGALPEGLATQIEALFGGWKKATAPRFVQHVGSFKPIPAARFDAAVRDKPNAILHMHQALRLNQNDPAAQALGVVVHVLGGGGLEGRLPARVRQQEGLSYGISAALETPSFGDDAELTIRASFAPDQRERIIAVVQEELARLTREGVSEVELARAKKSLAEGRKQARASEGQLAATLLWLGERREAWADVQRRDAELQALTVEQVNAAWRRLIRQDAFVLSTAGDFKQP